MPDPEDIELIRALQDEEIFLMPRPFEEAAKRLRWDVGEVLSRTRSLVDAGVIRRFGAALTPGNAGFRANSMVAWDIEDGRAEEAAFSLASHPRVSHCYIRPRFAGFPFNVYTMIHGTSREDLRRIIDEMAKAASPSSHRALDSVREFKKTSPVYFPKAPEPAGS